MLIARAAGQTLENSFRGRIFEPLGMKDTAFSVPANKLDRFGSYYSLHPQTNKLDVTDPAAGQWSRPPKFIRVGRSLIQRRPDAVSDSATSQ